MKHKPTCPVEAKDDGYSSCTCGAAKANLEKLQAETLSEKNLRLIREKQAICAHKNVDEQDGFVWCADCNLDFN